MNEPITNKKQMYRLLLAGKFGNVARAWDGLDAVLASDYRGHVSIRSKQVANPVRLYHVPFADLAAIVAALPPAQREPGLVLSESPPDEERVLQGELERGFGGLQLTYTFAPHPMRIAFEKQMLHAAGLRAKWLLEGLLDRRDWHDLEDLLDTWPDHVIEFSSFRNPLGTLRRRTIIWEVRKY